MKCCMVQVTGYVGIYTAASAWYISFAELFNEIWFKGRVSCTTWLTICIYLHTYIYIAYIVTCSHVYIYTYIYIYVYIWLYIYTTANAKYCITNSRHPCSYSCWGYVLVA